MICKKFNRNIVENTQCNSFSSNNKSQGLTSEVFYKLINSYLVELIPVGIDVEMYLNPSKMQSLNDICYVFCLDLQGYNMMPSVIGLLSENRKNIFKRILFGYDPILILDYYQTADKLFETFCETFPVKNINSKQNLWLKYSRGIIDSCTFLSKYNTAEDFNDYIDSFSGNLDALNELSDSIHGMGLALACNVIKDLGFTDYAKPDTHTIEVLTVAGFSTDDEKSVIEAIRKIARDNNDTAFNVDRIIWLICSGYYFKDNVKIGSHKNELIEKILKVKNI